MGASSPPTRRVVDIIELLIKRRDTATRLSDIVQALGLNQSTAYAILNELTNTGWVTRDPTDKTFSVGAALARLAGQIDQSPSVAHAARAAAAAAATKTGYAASVSERVGESLVITAFIAGGDDQWSASTGDRLPFAAPFGPAFAAWEPDSERLAWIERSGVNSPAFDAHLAEHLDQTRNQGYSVERMNPELAAAIPVMTKLQEDALSDSMRDHLNEILLELTDTKTTSTKPGTRLRHYVGAITAPILNPLGRATHNICVHPFTALSPRNVERIGRDLRQAASAIGAHTI
jgi:DNA-binding IclR family transcriptional regulator